jgi:hypothetical protein
LHAVSAARRMSRTMRSTIEDVPGTDR